MNNFKFNVGDLVEAVLWDLSYGAYTDWFEEYGLNNLLVRYRGNVINGERYRVIARGNHLRFKGVRLYAIEHLESKEIHLIKEDGLKLVKSKEGEMTRVQFDNLYLGKAVNCETEELAKEFLALADSVGYEWRSGDSLKEYTGWNEYEEQTCYYVAKDSFEYGPKNWFIKDRCEIINYQSSKNIPDCKEKDACVPIEKYNELKEIIKDQYEKIDNQRKHLKELNKQYNNRVNEIQKMKKDLKEYEQDLYQTRENERRLMQDIINLKNTLILEDNNVKALKNELETRRKEWLETFHELNEENKELKVLVYDLNKENRKLKEEKSK